MNKKKIFALCLIICLLATAVVGGTLAYFTDNEQATNTMVIGNIAIDIDEYTYMDEDGDGEPEWDVFGDDEFTLYPIKNELGITHYNKMVYTANVSESQDNAYIRNIVLIEANDALIEGYPNFANEGACCFEGIHYGYHKATEPVTSSVDDKVYYGSKIFEVLDEPVVVDGEKYWVVAFVEAQERAIPYDAALYSLHSVWMDKNIVNEQVAGWGEQVEVIVFSQGIQATGLTHAEAMAELGEINESNLQSWIGEENYQDATWTDKLPQP